MDELEWKTCDNPTAMLNALREIPALRKFRLFACACCRRVWGMLSDVRSRRAVEVAEMYVDGLVDEGGLEAAKDVSYSVHADTSSPDSGFSDAAKGMSKWSWEAAQGTTMAAMPFSTPNDAIWCCQVVSQQLALAAASFARKDGPPEMAEYLGRVVEENEQKVQCNLLRCIFGPNPFAPSPDIDPIWLKSEVVLLAKTAYENRSEPEGTLDTTQLKVLADALEEAGCNNTAILAHCRSDVQNVRGCWVVDLVIGKG